MSKALMIQGTTSNAGKSVIAAGLCRLLSRNGYSVAPFKPQNMALNSAVTIDQGEIGRSQAVQAEASGIEPHTDMNPILLKPNSDKGAQVIINGHSIGNMDAVEYHQFKKKAIHYVLESWERLTKQYDYIVAEGAGSPAEVNLRDNDVANMGFATVANCPVLLVADIDRGGVFAHLTGTMACLPASEQQLIKGFLINRFRGDRNLLDSGVDWLTETTGVSTLGVLPYLPGLHIEAEDAVDYRNRSDPASSSKLREKLTVVVPRIPRISNHTDFDVLRIHPDVDLLFVDQGDEKRPADLMVLPGSKSTISDLDWLRSNGWESYVQRHLRYGGKLIGICGGYQMIGTKIHDPQGLEGAQASRPGLGLIDYETTLQPEKQLTRVNGRFINGYAAVSGYEIHMGDTRFGGNLQPAIELSQGSGTKYDGVFSADNQIFCTYLHGVFDLESAREYLLDWAGLKSTEQFDYAEMKDDQLNRVADMLEREIGLTRVLSLFGEPD